MRKPCLDCVRVADYTPQVCDSCASWTSYMDTYRRRMAFASVSAAEREGMIARNERGRGKRV